MRFCLYVCSERWQDATRHDDDRRRMRKCPTRRSTRCSARRAATASFADEPVTDAQLHAIYEIMKHGPTTANSQPQRIVFLRSAGGEAAPRAGALDDQSREDAGGAGGGDLRLRPEIHRPPAALLSQQGCAEVVHENAGAHRADRVPQRHAAGGLFHAGGARARARCGPMSGFDNAKVDAEFFPDGQWKSNFLCNLGKGDARNCRRSIRGSDSRRCARYLALVSAAWRSEGVCTWG